MEKAIVSARAKGEHVQAIYHRYRHAGRPEKVMLGKPPF
jgi:hypothetical protein